MSSEGRRAVATRIVTGDMQEAFARLSADWNPMHMDAVAARRTPAGQPVVHGIHSLLWALDELARQSLLTCPPSRIRLRLLKWIYLGDAAVLSLSPEEGNLQSFQIQVEGFTVMSGDLTYADPIPLQDAAKCTVVPLREARRLSLAEMAGVQGNAFVAEASAAFAAFPSVSALFGTRAVAELAATSYVVGMEAPGLYSTFSKLDVALQPESARGASGLGYEVTYTDERFQKARIAVHGAAIQGTLEVFVRSPPAEQATIDQLASAGIVPGEFAGMVALIIGGSRGLGEVTAKLVAAGGGHPLISYAVGQVEAEKVASQIRAWGGTADTLHYDVRSPAAAQLADLPARPTHLFYFATSAIFQPRYQVFSAAVFAEFMLFYVDGFYNLCTTLAPAPGSAETLHVYYPSSIAVEERPPGMTEYSMAKAAGELLCQDINVSLPGIRIGVTRLPRLPTDQTSSVVPTRSINPVDVLLPILREQTKNLGNRSSHNDE